MRQLVGRDHAPTREQLPDNAILIARAMGPAALLDYDRTRLRGLVLEEGTANSHVSIVARALGIPAVGEVPNAPGIADPGDAIIVDGTSGSIYIRPSSEIESAYAERVRFRARRHAQYSALRDMPCVTKDGEKVELMINAGLAIDLPHIDDTGSAGIGLFRTELQFMVSQNLPRSSDQLALYRTVLDAARREAGNIPHPRYRRRQGAALYGDRGRGKSGAWLARDPARAGPPRAAARPDPCAAACRRRPLAEDHVPDDLGGLRIRRSQSHRRTRTDYLRQHGHSLPERIDIGTMVEVPALLYQFDELLKKVDFVSVGSNDLFQFMFAVDRGNAKVSERFEHPVGADPARAARHSCGKRRRRRRASSLCGEMASKPLGALALIGLGYRSLSLSATAHGPVECEALILDLDAKKAEAVMTPLLDAPDGSVSIRQKLTEFAEAEGLSFVARLCPHDALFALSHVRLPMLPEAKTRYPARPSRLARERAAWPGEFGKIRADHARAFRTQPADRGGEGLSRGASGARRHGDADIGSRNRRRDPQHGWRPNARRWWRKAPSSSKRSVSRCCPRTR